MIPRSHEVDARAAFAPGFADERDVDRFVEMLAKFERGELTEPEWRAFRLVHGTYGQRQSTSDSMLRAKLPQGIVTIEGLRAIADVAEKWSRGFCHITTRQNVQFHFLPLEHMSDAMRRLAEAGITTKEACGNAVRNVTTSVTSGVAADEAFDVRPWAEALTRFLLRHELSSTLPRKFKIAFNGGGSDHSFAHVNDIGWHARLGTAGDGSVQRAFKVTVAGGTATMCSGGHVLFDALPAADILAAALAILRVFDALGDRVHRHKNRMKFLVKQIGWESFASKVHDELERVRREGAPPLRLAPSDDEASFVRAPAPSFSELDALVQATSVRGPGITPSQRPARSLVLEHEESRWRASNVKPQKQDGFSVVTATVTLGDFTSGQLRAIALLAAAFSTGSVRLTASQNLVFRFVPNELVSSLYARLRAIGLGRPDAGSIADVVSCPGAETCKLAVTQSRGLGQLLGDVFAASPSLVDRAKGLELRASGCPNGCSLHHLAGIGFQGGMRKLSGRPVPQYFVFVGGGIDADGAHFGRLVAKVPARRAPKVVERLIALYEREHIEGETITRFLQRASVPSIKAVLAELEALDESDAKPEDFVDLSETTAFRPEASEGECAA